MLPEPNPAPTQKKMILQSDLSSPGKAPQISANFSEAAVHEERECSLTEATLQPLFYFFCTRRCLCKPAIGPGSSDEFTFSSILITFSESASPRK